MTAVEPGSAAAQAGIVPGYFILSANGQDIAVVQELIEVLRSAAGEQVWIGAIGLEAASITDAVATARLPRLSVAGEITPERALDLAQQLGLSFEPLDQAGVIRYLSLHPNTKMVMTVRRQGQEVTLTVHSREIWGRTETVTAEGTLKSPHRKTGRIGVLLSTPTRRAGVLEGLAIGAGQSAGSVVMVVQAVRAMIAKKIAAEGAGPIGIMALTAERAAAGWAAVLSLCGIISANLAVINLIPIPPFDGFHIVLLSYEGIIRRRISARPEMIIRLTGIFLIMLAFVWLVAKDITNLFLYGTP